MKKILFVGSEANPFAATGGLGDVLGSLPAALKAENPDYDVRVVMPLHSLVKQEYRDQMVDVCEFIVPLAWRKQYCGVKSLTFNGVVYYFIDNEFYFKRKTLYGNYDDGERYAYFSRAVIEMFEYIDFVPDVLHANDWQSALSIVYLKTKYSYPQVKTVYTIHNIEYQGVYGFDILWDVFDIPYDQKWIVEYDNCINLTKGAIVCADKITTVSHRYSEEIQTEYFGTALYHAIQSNKHKLTGIVNGIDYDLYNPVKDKQIPANFSKNYMTGKATCKAEVQKKFGLPVREDVPIIAMISRLATHKGFDLVRHVLEEALQMDVQFIILGTGEKDLEEFFSYVAGKYPEKAAAMLAYDKNLAKLLYAGADIFLMPSKSEPCGLSQMMASRYGTVPVVREVGGLFDTIKPYDPKTGKGNGLTFVSYNAHEMLYEIQKAVKLYSEKEQWNQLVENAMSADFSWKNSALQYIRMYNTL